MKYSFYLHCLILTVLFTRCLSESENKCIIDHAEVLIESNCDSAYFVLNSIVSPNELNDELFAHWCMLSGEVADHLHKDMPYTSFLLRAQTWFERYGTVYEQAQISLYLGRSYVEDKKYDEAMKCYVNALDIALRGKEYNVAGLVCSYMADLYVLKDLPSQARLKYKEGAEFFLKAHNKRSYSLALRDISYTYCLQDSFYLALQYLKQAESIVSAWNDSIAYSSITNALGNVYEMMDSLDTAKKYLLKSLDYDQNDMTPTYLVLSRMYRNSGDMDSARYYLQKSKMNINNRYTLAGITYQDYLLEKELDNPYKALSLLESYCQISDSVSLLQNEARIDEIEKKYNHIKILNENDQLRINQLYYFIMLIVAVAGCLFWAFLYQLKSKRDNEIMYNQQKELDSKEKRLLQLVVDLETKEKDLERLRVLLSQNKQPLDIGKLYEEKELTYQRQKEEVLKIRKEILYLKNKMLFSMSIVRKIIKLSNIVIPGATMSPLLKRDWTMFMNKVDDIYILFKERLLDMGIREGSVEMQYCYLSLLSLDKNQEAVILHINPDSVSKTRFRVRQKLQISGENISINDYLIRICVFG